MLRRRQLRRIKEDLGSDVRLIQLVAPDAEHAELANTEELSRVAAYAWDLRPHYSQLVEGQGSRRPHASALAGDAHDAGLRVHAYTFRREDVPAYARTLEELLEIFLGRIGIDGVFCDHPDVAVRVRASLLEVQGGPEKSLSSRAWTAAVPLAYSDSS